MSFDPNTFSSAFDAGTVTSIAVTAPTTKLIGGASVQFTAIATYSDGHTADVTSLVTWTSTDPSLIQVAANGSAKVGLAKGVATVSATL